MKSINVDQLHVLLIVILFGIILEESLVNHQLQMLLNWTMKFQLLVGLLKETLAIGSLEIVGDNLGEKVDISEL